MLFMVIENDNDRLKIERLYEQYSALMYKVAYHFLRDKFAAEDAVQQSFIKILSNLHKIDENNSHKTRNYLVVICRNVAIDLYNKNNMINIDEIEDNLSYGNDTVESILINKENLNRLLEQICSLNNIYQEVLLLRFSQNYSVAEISSMLNISEANVRKRIERSKKELLKMLCTENEGRRDRYEQ